MKKIKEVEKIQEEIIEKSIEIEEEQFHIYDFLIRTKLTRNQEDIFVKKYESAGLKTIKEWQDLTGKQILEIFK